MTNASYINVVKNHLMGTYAQLPLVAVKGKDTHLQDADGNTYIDFGSGIGVNSLGYCNDLWTAAVCDQVRTLNHVSNYYYNEPMVLLAQKLTQSAQLSKVFFSNSGAEANEGAIKLARKYSFDKYGKGRNKIVTLHQSFHGRTITTLEATGQDILHNYFFPFTEGFLYSAPTMSSIESIVDETVCAVMIELIQGEGGVHPLDSDFVQQLRAFTTQHDLLLIVDEVQTGVGRTGKPFCFMHYGIIPDLLTVAKGLGGGLPIGAFLCSEALHAVMGVSTHGSTFGGNPICCRAANVILDTVFEPIFLQEVMKKSLYIQNKLQHIHSPYIGKVKGLGLMLGIEIKHKNNKTIVQKMFDHKILVLSAGHNVIRFLPPLTISYEEIDTVLNVFEQIIKEDE